jgi:hypothetical protein
MLSLTKFNGIDPHGKPQTISWDQLAISPLQIVDIKENATSTGFYKLKAPEHYRKKENVISKHCLVLDLDQTSLTFDEITDKLKQYKTIVTTTWSHDPANGKNKYRVIIDTDRDLTVEEYPKLLRGFLEKESFLKGQVDEVVKDAARLFFDYSIPSAREHLARKEILHGAPINVDEIINLQVDPIKQEIKFEPSKRIRDEINNDRTSPLETPYEIEKLRDALGYLSPDVGRGIGSFYSQDTGEPEKNYWLGVILAIKSLHVSIKNRLK